MLAVVSNRQRDNIKREVKIMDEEIHKQRERQKHWHRDSYDQESPRSEEKKERRKRRERDIKERDR